LSDQIPDPDFDATLRFLIWLDQDGPWVLFALDSTADSAQKVFTKEFDPGESKLWSWCADLQAQKCNLYFLANRRSLGVKTRTKADISHARHMYVDIDVAKGEPFFASLEAIKRKFDNLRDLPEPSCLVDTGGGYQAFWKLDKPIDLTVDRIEVKDPADARRRPTIKSQTLDDYEARNKTIEALLNGDHCHSVEHIFRLPGSVNFGKPKKFVSHPDRVIRRATVVSINDKTYPLSAFPRPAGQNASNDGRAMGDAGTGTTVVRPIELVFSSEADAVRYTAHEDLPSKLPADSKLLIITGRDAASKFGNDRSKYLWRAVNDMVRVGMTDDEMIAVIMNPIFKIAESVIERPDARAYAEKQLRDARAASIHPILGEMNRVYLSIQSVDGHYRIAKLDTSGLLMDGFMMSKKDFLDGLNHQRVDVDGDSVPMGTFWYTHPAKHHVERVVFLPGEERSRPGEYNRWRSHGVRHLPGDGDQLWLDHLLKIGCSGDIPTYEYLLNWMARAVQMPGTPGQVAIVLRGQPASGKGTIANALMQIFAPWTKHVTKSDRIVNKFNSITEHCVFLFLDEAVWSGDRRSQATLKGLITEKMNEVERKFGESVQRQNCLHIMMASNDDHVVHIDADDRRFLVIEVSSEILARSKDEQILYFQAIRKSMESGGIENLLWRLVNRDLRDFNVWDYPRNAETKKQAFMSGDPMVKWMYQKLEDQYMVPSLGREPRKWTDPIAAAHARYDYLKFAQIRNMDRGDTTRMGMFLARLFPGIVKHTKVLTYVGEDGNTVTGSAHSYTFPPLETCRACFEKLYGVHEWSKIPEVVYDADIRSPGQEHF
jgi:Mesyanzhinovviridae DNA primase